MRAITLFDKISLIQHIYLFPVAFRTEQTRSATANRPRVSIRVTKIGQCRGRGRPRKIFLLGLSTLITMQNLVTISHTVCPHDICRVKSFGDALTQPLRSVA